MIGKGALETILVVIFLIISYIIMYYLNKNNNLIN